MVGDRLLVLGFYFFMFVNCFIESYAHTCNHEAPKHQEVIHNVHLEPFHKMRKRSIENNLRIKEIFDDSINQLRPDRKNIVKDVLLPDAINYWQKTLKVRQTTGPIRLVRNCSTPHIQYKSGEPYHFCADGCSRITKCGEVPVPEEHLEQCRSVEYDENQGKKYVVDGYAGVGVTDADFVLYVSAVHSKKCTYAATVAYAAYCQLEGAMDRPVAGYINLCPNTISTKDHDVKEMVSTIKHEILHALGFSAGLYAFYRDDNGNPRTPRNPISNKPDYNNDLHVYKWSDSVIQEVYRHDWQVVQGPITRKFYMMVTPRVLKEVRNHFNCSTLEGAELENQGINGTFLTHWEKRIFENEFMTGTYTQNPLVSRITLALMEDTGWYRADYDMAENLEWGKNLGCEFVQRSCMEWIHNRQTRKQHIHPYCSQVKSIPLHTDCTENREAVALCNLVKYDIELPAQYRYFATIPGSYPGFPSQYGGSVPLADFCPYIQEFSWKDAESRTSRGSRCTEHFNSAEIHGNYFLESYGNQSKCFEHFSPWTRNRCRKSYPAKHWGSACYKYSCSGESGLIIEVSDTSYQCLKEGHILDITIIKDGWLHDGTIICPSCEEICEGHIIKCPPEREPVYSNRPSAIDIPCEATHTFIDNTIFFINIFTCFIASL